MHVHVQGVCRFAASLSGAKSTINGDASNGGAFRMALGDLIQQKDGAVLAPESWKALTG